MNSPDTMQAFSDMWVRACSVLEAYVAEARDLGLFAEGLERPEVQFSFTGRMFAVQSTQRPQSSSFLGVHS